MYTHSCYFRNFHFIKAGTEVFFCIIYFYFSSLLFRLYATYIFIGTLRFTYLSSVNCRSSMKKIKNKINKEKSKLPLIPAQHLHFLKLFYTFPICTFDIYIVIVIAGMQHYTQLWFFIITCISHITYNYCFNFYIFYKKVRIIKERQRPSPF